jgi:hypothetical protein
MKSCPVCISGNIGGDLLTMDDDDASKMEGYDEMMTTY